MISLRANDWTIEGVETVLFDKDGTFIDLHYFWGKMTELRVVEIIKRYNLDTSLFSKLCEHLGYVFETGRMLSDGITALYSRPKIIDIFSSDLRGYGVEVSHRELEEIFDYVSEVFYRDMEKHTKPIEPAIGFIRELRKRGLKLGIVTSDSVESTRLTLDYFGWGDLFDVFMGRESTVEHKESGVSTRMALEAIGASSKTAIMVGDAPMDYLAAINADVERTILVSTGQIDKEELLKTSPYVVDSLSEIEIY